VSHEAQVPGSEHIFLEPSAALELSSALLKAIGAPPPAARLVSEHLVEASRLGIHSHGLIRLPQYVGEVAAGIINPAATAVETKRQGARAEVDGRTAFGQVAAGAAVEVAAEIATSWVGAAVVTVKRAGHVGRIGAFTEMLARRGLVGLAFASGSREGHRVAPVGAREGRLATNPLSWAVPTKDEPIVADFATSATTEGHVRWMLKQGGAVQEGLRDSSGRHTTDPAALYGHPPGFIVPLGGDRSGHKGYALGLLVEVLATTLARDLPTDEKRAGNNLALVAIAVDDDFLRRASVLADYVRSAAPIREGAPILLPGEPERRRLAAGGPVLVDRATWAEIVAQAEVAGIPLPAPV
jgi:uncharacterized oxidoreductase